VIEFVPSPIAPRPGESGPGSDKGGRRPPAQATRSAPGGFRPTPFLPADVFAFIQPNSPASGWPYRMSV